MEKRIISNKLYIDRWIYSEPELVPDSEGNIVIVSRISVGPCESFKWGITSDKKCFVKYTWSEDDWFEDSSNTMIIDKEELVEKVQEMKVIVRGTSLEYWISIYDSFIDLMG